MLSVNVQIEEARPGVIVMFAAVGKEPSTEAESAVAAEIVQLILKREFSGTDKAAHQFSLETKDLELAKRAFTRAIERLHQ